MFRCQITDKLIGPGVRANRVVVETRKRIYTNYNPYTRETWETEGWEIVRELLVSDEGKSQLEQNGTSK